MNLATEEPSDAVRWAGLTERVEGLQARVRALPEWEHSSRFDCDGMLRRLAELATVSDERKLVVVILGGCGVGKSTLLNALARQPEISATGATRPTTHEVVAYAAHPDDAACVREAVGREAVRIVASDAAEGLRRLVIVDTPDTNSVAAEAHRPLVAQVLAVADVLVCLFSAADNPKAADQLTYLQGFVEAFPQAYLYVGLTHVDRLTDAERAVVAADFRKHLHYAWSRAPKAVFELAAKEHAIRPSDGVVALEKALTAIPLQAGGSRAVRLARAEAWVCEVGMSIAASLARVREPAERAVALVADCARRQAERLTAWLADPVEDPQWTVDAVREGRGPVFALLRIVASLERGGRALTGWRGRRGRELGPGLPRGGDLIGMLHLEIARTWPDIAARLREAGFGAAALSDPLRSESVGMASARLAARLEAVAQSARASAVAWCARPSLQVGLSVCLLALPAVGLLHGVWRLFVENAALPAGYVRGVVGLTVLLCVLQLVWVRWRIRCAGRRGWRGAAVEANPDLLRDLPVVRELHALNEWAAAPVADNPACAR